MKITVDAAMMKEMFVTHNRDYYTTEALETLLEWYDEIDENTEFDPIAICCEWTEYGDTPCLTWDDLMSDYGYLLDKWGYDRDPWRDDETAAMTEIERMDKLVELLEQEVVVIRLRDSVLIMAF